MYIYDNQGRLPRWETKSQRRQWRPKRKRKSWQCNKLGTCWPKGIWLHQHFQNPMQVPAFLKTPVWKLFCSMSQTCEENLRQAADPCQTYFGLLWGCWNTILRWRVESWNKLLGMTNKAIWTSISFFEVKVVPKQCRISFWKDLIKLYPYS